MIHSRFASQFVPRLIVVLLLGVISETLASADTVESNLCEALHQAGPGEELPVHLSGVIVSGPEHQVFFDPDQPRCLWDVQPSTWVELPREGRGRSDLDRAIKETRAAAVTVRGVLLGPRILGPDNLSLNPMEAYANRIAGRRYGHLGAFRTKLVVSEVIDAQPAPSSIRGQAIWRRLEPDESDLSVEHSDVPRYPEEARRAGIAGDVVVEVTVMGGKVIATNCLSGDRLLGVQAKANIATWQFPEKTTATFKTLFVYRLERSMSGDRSGPHIELHLPRLVQITATHDGW